MPNNTLTLPGTTYLMPHKAVEIARDLLDYLATDKAETEYELVQIAGEDSEYTFKELYKDAVDYYLDIDSTDETFESITDAVYETFFDGGHKLVDRLVDDILLGWDYVQKCLQPIRDENNTN